MSKKLKDLVETTRKQLEESHPEVPDGHHWNEKVNRPVKLPSHLDKQAEGAHKASYMAHDATRMGSKEASTKHHEASAAHFEASHQLKESGFMKLARHHHGLSTQHRRMAIVSH